MFRGVGRAMLVAAASLICDGTALGGASAGKGDILVEGPVGARVALDGIARGELGARGEVLLGRLIEGAHELEVSLPGAVRQRFAVIVEPERVAIVRARPFQPEPGPRGGGRGAALTVEVPPGHATIDAPSLGWKKIALDAAPFIATHLPAGRHKMMFCNDEKCLDYVAELRASTVLSLSVEFEPAAVRDVSPARHAAWVAWGRQCGAGDRDACRQLCDLERAMAPESGPRAPSGGSRLKAANGGGARETPEEDARGFEVDACARIGASEPPGAPLAPLAVGRSLSVVASSTASAAP